MKAANINKEPLAYCTECMASLYESDKACSFYEDEYFCEDHAVTLSEAISYLEERLKDGFLNEGETAESVKELIVNYRSRLMREGDTKPFLSVL